MICPYNYKYCGQNNTFEFNEGGESQKISIVNMTYGEVCFYIAKANCAIPKIQIDSVANATIEYTDFIEDIVSLSKTGLSDTDNDSEINRLDFRLPLRATIFTNSSSQESNGTLAYSGNLTFTNAYKSWGTTVPGEDPYFQLPVNQDRCRDRYLYVVVTSMNNTMYANFTLSTIAFAPLTIQSVSSALTKFTLSMVFFIMTISLYLNL